MKYRVEKDQPIPGRIIDLTVQINSIVDSPANNRKFLSMKGMNNEMLTEIEKKALQEAGLSAEEIQKNEGDNGILSKLKKFFTGEPKPMSVTAVTDPPLTLESISKMLDEKISKALVNNSESNPEAPADTDEQALAKIEANIEIEKKALAEKVDIQKKLTEKTKELEELKKMRLPGNANYHANNQENLTPEQIKKRNTENIFKGSALV